MRRGRTPRRSFASAWVAIGSVCALQLVGSVTYEPAAGDRCGLAMGAAIATAQAAAPPASQSAGRAEGFAETTLLTESDPLTSAVAVTAFLRAPAAPPAPPGLRYLIERLLLDPNHPAGARAMALRSRGWRVQAFTTPDYTAYQVVGDRHSLDESLRLLRALLSEPPLPAGGGAELSLSQHRQSIALLQGSTPSPAGLLSRLFALAYSDHPGARPIIGTQEQLASYSATAVREHWAQFYRPAALTVVLSGAVDPTLSASTRQQLSELEAQIAHSRGRATPASVAALGAARTAGRPWTHHAGPQVRLLPPSELAAGLPALWLGFALDGASPTEIAALEVAAGLPQPGGREAALLLGPAGSPALFVLRGPAPTPDAGEGLPAIVDAALHLGDAATEAAVSRARRRLLLDVARRSETPAGRALRVVGLSLAGSDEASWGRRVSGLTAGDVQRALGRFLRLDRLSVLLRSPTRQTSDAVAQNERRLRERLLALSPRVAANPPPSPGRASVGTTARHEAPARAQVLRGENGAHVVLLPDPPSSATSATPRRQLVGLAALWPGGRKREEARLRGLHELLVRVWPHATASLPSFALSGLLADLNLTLQAEVSDDALALRGQLPSDGLPQALTLIHDCLESARISESEVERARRDVLLASRRTAVTGEAASPRAPRPPRSTNNPDFDAARYAEQLFAHVASDSRSSPASHEPGKPMRSPRYEDLAQSVTVLTTRHVQDLLRSYERAPLLLAVVGDFDPESVTAQLAPWLGTLKPLSELPRTLLPVENRALAPPPAATKPDGDETPGKASDAVIPPQLFAYSPTAQAHLVLGARVPGCASSDRSTPLALDVLLELLASEGGTGGAQQLLLNRRALAFSVEGALSGCLPERTLSLYVATSPRNLDAAEAGLRDELRRLSDHPVAPEALALARERLASRWVLASQRRSDRALQLARGLLFGLPDPALGGGSPPELLRQIDAAKLQALAKQYLADEKLLRAAVLPESQRIALGTRGVTLRAVEPAPAVDVSPAKQPAKQLGKQGGKTADRSGGAERSERPGSKSAQSNDSTTKPPTKPTTKPTTKQATKQVEKPRAAAPAAPHAKAGKDTDRRRSGSASKHAAKLPQRL